MTHQETVDTNTDVEGEVPLGLVDQAVHKERVPASVPPLGSPDSSQEVGTDLQYLAPQRLTTSLVAVLKKTLL